VLCLIIATCLTAVQVATGGTALLSALGVNLPALKLKGNATRGKRVFRTAACFQCHALKSAHSGAGFAGAPDLDKTKPSFALVVRRVTLGYASRAGPIRASQERRLRSARVEPWALRLRTSRSPT
jgi:mono/diheme cytochrome c family protein